MKPAGARPLERRLADARVQEGADPVTAWRTLREHEGSTATVVELYELVAADRGVVVAELSRSERRDMARRVMPEIWPGFELTDDSDRPGDVITLVEADPAWPERYEWWRAAISGALGETARRIEHVGSTAVPGLAAKAIIDVQVSVDDIEDEVRYVSQLEAVGVQLRSRDELHRYFRPFPDRPRDVHVHVCTVGSRWEAEHLLFRDRLRADPEARDRYEAVKREAARRWPDDGIAYTEAKTAVVLGILAGDAP